MTEDAIRDILAKVKMVHVPAFPGNRYDALELAKDLLHLKQKDWHSLTRVLCKAREAWLVFSQGNVFVELRKETDKLRLRIVVRSGSLKKSRNWRYNLEELVGAMSLLHNDRYACLDSIGNMLVFGPADYRCFLRMLLKCSMCSVAFRIGNTHVKFLRGVEEEEGVHVCLETKRGRKLLEHCFNPRELQFAELTMKRTPMPLRTKRVRIIRIRGRLSSV